jgi:hypothetical protein
VTRSMKTSSAALLGLVCWLAATRTEAVARPDPPKPAPTATALAEAEKEIRALFKADYAKKRPADQAELARKLLKTAEDEKGNAAAKYVLYREARDLAARGGDVALAMEACGSLDRAFVSDLSDLKLAALDTAEKSRAPAQEVVDAALDAADEAVQVDAYPAAARFVKIATTAAERARIPGLTQSVAARAREINTIQKAYEAVEADRKALQGNPNDKAAAGRYGKFLCFSKGEWEVGLPLLVSGDDEKLKAAAEKDVARPETAAARVEAGDAWWDAAEKLDAASRVEARLRAHHWYQAASAELTGLNKVRIEKRIAEMAKVAEQRASRTGGGWRIIFRSGDASIWNTEANRGRDVFAIPLERVPADIRYLKLTETAKGNYVVIEMTKARLDKLSDQDGYGWQGTNRLAAKGYHLGIFDTAMTDRAENTVTINAAVGQVDARGWGFGHRVFKNDRQGFSWAGVQTDPVVFEIAVKSTDLTPEETKRLLKKKK